MTDHATSKLTDHATIGDSAGGGGGGGPAGVGGAAGATKKATPEAVAGTIGQDYYTAKIIYPEVPTGQPRNSILLTSSSYP